MQDFLMTGADCMEAIRKTAGILAQNRDYITGLDAATGDGDHWINMNMGYEKLLEQQQTLAALDPPEFFKKAAMVMMSAIGGSSGVLYGTAFLRAAGALGLEQGIDSRGLCSLLRALCEGIMERGRSKPGDKTMVDAMHPAVNVFEQGLAHGTPTVELLHLVREAAGQGAKDTRALPAVRGRAYYQADRGVGHVDPGAITMAYLIDSLTQTAQECMK